MTEKEKNAAAIERKKNVAVKRKENAIEIIVTEKTIAVDFKKQTKIYWASLVLALSNRV